MTNTTITICSSADFYKHVNEVASQLANLGLNVQVPHTAQIMAKTSDYDSSHYKTWYDNEKDYSIRADLMRKHFDKIMDGDIVLVINDEKRNTPNYVGANVLMEMAIGWYQNQPIFLLNELPQDSPFIEEIKGMGVIPLHGDILNLVKMLANE